jgi:hypothetical protein
MTIIDYFTKYEEALPICRQLVEEFPYWSKSWIVLGGALWLKAEKEGSKEILKEAKSAYLQTKKI